MQLIEFPPAFTLRSNQGLCRFDILIPKEPTEELGDQITKIIPSVEIFDPTGQVEIHPSAVTKGMLLFYLFVPHQTKLMQNFCLVDYYFSSKHKGVEGLAYTVEACLDYVQIKQFRSNVNSKNIPLRFNVTFQINETKFQKATPDFRLFSEGHIMRNFLNKVF